jgi:hypothetical protein
MVNFLNRLKHKFHRFEELNKQRRRTRLLLKRELSKSLITTSSQIISEKNATLQHLSQN